VLLVDRPGHHGHPSRPDPFGDGDRIADGPGDFVPRGLVLSDKRGSIKAAVGDKHAHGHAKAGQLGADFLLHFRSLSLDVVVFPGGEALVGGKAHLIEVGFASLAFEGARVRRVVEGKLRLRRGE
jgi:hypothetical protein